MEFLCPQVYVRRAYIAYELNSVQHRQLKDNTCVVEFQFMLPTSHPNRSDHCRWRFGRGLSCSGRENSCWDCWRRGVYLSLIQFSCVVSFLTSVGWWIISGMSVLAESWAFQRIKFQAEWSINWNFSAEQSLSPSCQLFLAACVALLLPGFAGRGDTFLSTPVFDGADQDESLIHNSVVDTVWFSVDTVWFSVCHFLWLWPKASTPAASSWRGGVAFKKKSKNLIIKLP